MLLAPNALEMMPPQRSEAETEKSAHTPEQELLLRCARTVIDAETAARIQLLLAQDIDWTYLLQMASEHQVAPLFAWNICAKFHEACPRIVIDQLKSLLHGNAVRNSILTRELTKLLDLLESHAIRAIPYKGPVLAEGVYGHLALRSYSDLDILVDEWDYRFRIVDLLMSHGWQVTNDFGWEIAFKDASGSVHLDVHVGFTHQEMPFHVDFNQIWKRCTTISIGGKVVSTFSPSDMLIVLCIQLAKDAGEWRRPPLIKICDIAELVRRHQTIDWALTTRTAKSVGALRVLYLGILVAHDVLGINLPPEILEEGKARLTSTSLINHVRERVLGKSGNRYSRPELLNGSRWHAEIRERFRDRNKLVRKLHYAVTPNIYDYSFAWLPKSLFSLYYLVRPVRLIVKYARKLSGLVLPRSRI